MTKFKAAYTNELSKLLAKKKYVVFLILEVLICAIVMVVQLVIQKVLENSVSFNIMNMSMTMLSFFITVFIPLIVFMAACDLFASEAHDGSIRAVLIRPASRFKVFLAKSVAIYTVAVGYLMSLFVVSYLLQITFGGGLEGFATGLGAYILDILPLTIVVLMAALVNQFTKSPSLAMLLAILIYIVLMVAGMFIPQLSGMLFTGYLQWHNLWLGITIPLGSMAAKIGLLLGYGTVFFAGGYYLFERKDI